MINSLHLINFKPFEDRLLEFRPLTLLSGLNSTGKSSVLQSLLLLRQSYRQGLLSKKGLALNGDLVNIGTAQDALFEGATKDIIRKQLEDIRTGQLELPTVVKALFELQNCSKNWNNGVFSTQGYYIETSGESEPTLNQYSQQRTFRCLDGEYRLFEQHVKLRACNWRIHFLAETSTTAIVVGYIGHHLPTVKY